MYWIGSSASQLDWQSLLANDAGARALASFPNET
jgi:hypothetical protein